MSDDTEGVRRLKDSFHHRAWMAGLLHDLGKYRQEFQEYQNGIRARGIETNHSVYGAAAKPAFPRRISRNGPDNS